METITIAEQAIGWEETDEIRNAITDPHEPPPRWYVPPPLQRRPLRWRQRLWDWMWRYPPAWRRRWQRMKEQHDGIWKRMARHG